MTVENQKLQNRTKTQQSIEHYQWRGRACQKIQSCCLSFCHFSPPPPHFRRIRGTFAHSSSPEPPYLVENIPPISRQMVTIAFYKHTHFPGFIGKSSRDKRRKRTLPPSPRKWEHTCDPLV